jgi:hypothetical protein
MFLHLALALVFLSICFETQTPNGANIILLVLYGDAIIFFPFLMGNDQARTAAILFTCHPAIRCSISREAFQAKITSGP